MENSPAAVGLLKLWVRNPEGLYMSVSLVIVECCQVEFSVSVPTDCGVCLSVIVKPTYEGALPH